MSSSRPSQQHAPSSSSNVLASSSTGARASETPSRSHRSVNDAKEMRKRFRRLEQLQRARAHVTNADSSDPLSLGGGAGEEVEVVLDEDGQRVLVPISTIGEEDEGVGALPDGVERIVGVEQEITTQYLLTRQRLEVQARAGGLASLAGQGPDGAALARAAAKGLKGKNSAPHDSFLHEASFVFNPLTRRVPPATPRKTSSGTSGAGPSRSRPSAVASGKRPAVSAPPTEAGGADDDGEALPMRRASKEVQEALILEDLLFVLMGIEGSYITYAPKYTPEDAASRLRGAQWSVDAALDPSLRDLVERILPLATFYTSIFAFVEMDASLEYGTVTHALCAAIRELLKEYEVLLVQLEHQLATSETFTLQRFFFYVHPTLRTLDLVHKLTSSIAAISHAPLLGASDSDDGSNSSDSDDDASDADSASTASAERERRALLGLDDDDDDEVKGGIVKGGEVLSILWERCERMRGDATAHSLYTTLFHRASQPYARILLRWITTGHLSDTYEEFMIAEDARVTVASLEVDPTDEYWERRYTLRDEAVRDQREQRRQHGLQDEDFGERGFLTGGAKIPAFLEPWKDKILLAGKYLNVVRECGHEVAHAEGAIEAAEPVAQGQQGEELIIMSEASFLSRIEEAYQRANSALLRLLLVDHNIIPRLRSLRHYFFFSSSDFFSSFLEAAGRELRKKVNPTHIREATLMRLQSHLGMVLGSSSTVGFADPYREDVRVDLAAENAYDQLKRIADTRGGVEEAARVAKARDRETSSVSIIELIQFDLTVKFPISLVISKKNILRWQFLQRPLINLKSVERSLSDVWMEHLDGVWRERLAGHAPLQHWKARVFKLRHRMMFFVQQLTAFMTSEILEPNWRELVEKMEKATTVDQFMKDHFDFLNRCRKELMLTNFKFVDLLARLTSLISVFCDFRHRFRDQLHMERSAWLAQREDPERAGEGPPSVSPEVLGFIAKVEKKWDDTLRAFRTNISIQSTTENPAAMPLSYRLASA